MTPGVHTIMHCPRSLPDTRRLRLASLMLLGNRLLILTAIGLLLVSMFANDHQLTILGSGFVIISFLLIIAQWIAASHAGCPLCQTPVFSPMRCMKHHKARRLLGSYQLRVALAIMFTDRFRCPYCNKDTAMDVGETLPSSRPRGSNLTHVSRLR